MDGPARFDSRTCARPTPATPGRGPLRVLAAAVGALTSLSLTAGCGEGGSATDMLSLVKPLTYECDGGKRNIPTAWVCDGNIDCKDGTDETKQCGAECEGDERDGCQRFFACEGTGRLIPVEWKCDGEPDCALDKNGEASDESAAACGERDKVKCGTSDTQVLAEAICDRFVDCPDASDEAPERCGHWAVEFPCPESGTTGLWCDGFPDCRGGADEAPEAGCTLFACQDKQGTKLPRFWVCDGQPDCPDGRDEERCTIRCGTKRVEGRTCDGVPDCEDGSDEHDCGGFLDGPVGLDGFPGVPEGPDVGVDAEPKGDDFGADGGVDLEGDPEGEPPGSGGAGVAEGGTGGPGADDGLGTGEGGSSVARPHICLSGESIDVGRLCDDAIDCQTGEDEDPVLCAPGSPYLAVCANGARIPQTWWCDAAADCADGSDEAQCGVGACQGGRCFQCDGESMAGTAVACDGFPDCADFFDEFSCMVACDGGENLYVPQFVCDGYPDCMDGADEAHCEGGG